MKEQRTSWHNTCCNRWSNSKLLRKQNNNFKSKNGIQCKKHLKRRSTESAASCCIFFLEKHARQMEAEMQDEATHAKFPPKDFIASNARYHFRCLTSYRDKYYASANEIKRMKRDVHYNKAKSSAYKFNSDLLYKIYVKVLHILKLKHYKNSAS